MKYTAAVITVSDRCARNERADTSGPAVIAMLEEAGYLVTHISVIPDDMDVILSELLFCTGELDAALVITTGGTGFSPRDITPEATEAVIERAVPGIPEAMRFESMKHTNRACLSRAVAGIRNRTLIVNLPGSERAARENLAAVLEPIAHGLDTLRATGPVDCAAPSEGDA